MCDFDLEKRKKYVQELDLFIDNTECSLEKIVSNLGWTIESMKDDSSETIACPFFASHRVPVKSLERHLEACEWKAEGYSQFDKPFSEPQSKQNNASSVQFDEDLQAKVLLEAKQNNPTLNISVEEQLIPRTSDRLFSDFTRDERRVLYEYVISNTSKPEIGKDITELNKLKCDDNNLSSETSFLEHLAQIRDLKRRRTRHRGVHTNKKSHIEILRQVINQQMETYAEYISQNTKNNSIEKDQHFLKKNSEYEYKKLRIFSKESENENKKLEKRQRSEHESKHSHRSRSRSKIWHKSRSRSRSRSKNYQRSRSRSKSKHRKKDKHRSRDRHEKKKKARSKDRKASHKDHKKRRRSRS